MRSQTRGRAVGGELVSYRRSCVDPLAQPAPPPASTNAFHSDECTCPRCSAERAAAAENERDVER